MRFIRDFTNPADIVSLFEQMGAIFFISPGLMIEKLKKIRAFVFDWDGVFNNGQKGISNPSTFSEADVSGINLMRYSIYRISGEIPSVIIITGESNENAINLAKRENYNLVYQKVINKVDACIDSMSKLNVLASEVACVFDDFNDVSMARICSLRFMIRREASPLFHSFVVKQGWCDYISASAQLNNPIREVTELCMGLLGIYENVCITRTNFEEDYKNYIKKRLELKPAFFSFMNGLFIENIP
jgi:3-deoxy-D-manno-octulosonate 8-phosphate phosphatase (KDO 8-P phosphatase)